MLGFSLLVGHLLGDFILQNDWQANNKKKRTWPCLVHCVWYTLAVITVALPELLLSPGVISIIFITHFGIDRTPFIEWWMRNVSGQTSFLRRLEPWSIICVDQVFHLTILWVVVTLQLRGYL